MYNNGRWNNRKVVGRCSVCGRFTPKTTFVCDGKGVVSFYCETCKEKSGLFNKCVCGEKTIIRKY